MTLIDSHAHYENKQFNHDRHDLLASMPSKNVELVINVGCNLRDSISSIQLADTYSHVYATVGIHPHNAKTLTDVLLEQLIQLSAHNKVVAYGEIGLDFHYNFSSQDVQRYWFKQQLQAAYDIGLPVVIHSREANQEVYDILASGSVHGGVVHSFSGDAHLAQAYVEMGLYIGVGGVVTFDKTGQLQAAVAAVPLDHILLETDAPYLTPAPYRGKRNESHYLFHVAEAIAEIKGVTTEEVCNVTTQNTRKLFARTHSEA